MWHDHMWNGPWMMGWGGLPMLLLWIFVIGLAIYLIKSFLSSSDAPTGDSALQTLRDRLASGDIDQEEFDSLLKKIKNSQ